MAESKNPLLEISVEQINQRYKDHYITAAERNTLLRQKARAEVDKALGNDGFASAVLRKTIENVQEGWDNIKQGATDDPNRGPVGDIKEAGRALWGTLQVVTSVFNAIGEVSGSKAEQMALDAGASPGLARVINIAVDVGTGFIPVGGAVRTAVKGAQALGKAGNAGKAAAKTGEAVNAAAKAQEAEAVMTKAINQGLKADGVKGVIETADGTKLIGEAAKQLTPQEAFTKNLRKFRREMEEITETKSHQVTLAEASKLGIGIEDLRGLVPGTALKESEMAAYLKALDEPVDDLVAWAKKTLEGETGAGEIMAKKLGDFFEYSPKFRAAEVTAGRSVEILKETPPMKSITNMLMAWYPEAIAKGDFNSALRTMAEDITELAAAPGKLKALQVQATDTIGKHGWERWNEVGREIYYNTLLARPVTQARNFIGNTFAAVNSVGERAMGSMFSLDNKSIWDRANPMKNEGLYQANAMFSAIGDGAVAYGKAFVSVTADEASKLDFIPHKIGGAVGRIINLPSDSLRGMDNFFKTILTRGDLAAQAVRKGMGMGMKGDELADYVTRRTNMPSVEMMEQAKDFALSGTFQDDLGVIGKRLQGLMQAGPLWTLFPFMKTPMNLAKYAWNRTPGLQLLSSSLYDDIAAGGARADMAIGRLTMSNLMGMFWYGLAQEGLITGGGPSDPALKRSWLGEKKPYSILGKDAWYNVPNLEPATTPMFLMADFAEVMNQLDDPTAEQTAMAIGLAGTRDIVDKSYWQTVGDVVDLIGSARAGEQPSKNAMQIAAGPALTMSTGGPLVGSVARIDDPVRREARSFVDQWRARIPGFGEGIPPVRDGYGDPMLVPQAVGSKWLSIISPFTAQDIEADEIKKEGARLQAKLPMFPWNIGGKVNDSFDIRAALPGDQLPVELTAQQRDRWQVIYRNIIRHPEMGLKSIMNRDEYKNGTFAAQREMFMDYLAQARAGAKDALLIEDVGLAEKSVKAQAGRYLPLLQQDQRPAAEAQITESVNSLSTMLPEQAENLSKFGIMDSGADRDAEIISRGDAQQ